MDGLKSRTTVLDEFRFDRNSANITNGTGHANIRIVIYPVPITARAMNTVKFRKDRKHKSRDKRRIVGGLL